MKKVLVTGGTGFIGTALCRHLLEKGYKVYCVSIDKSSISHPNLVDIILDMNEFADIGKHIDEDIDYVINLAWLGVQGTNFTKYDVQLNNAKCSCDLLLAAKELNVKKFVYIGSAYQAELRNHFDIGYKKMHKHCMYGVSKLAGDVMCNILARQNNIEYNCAMLASAFGPNSKNGMIENFVIKDILTGVSPKLVDGEDIYDWVYVDDAVKMLEVIMLEGENFEQYYVGNESPKTFRETIEEIRDILDPSVELKFGEFPNNSNLDYSFIDTKKLYENTSYKSKSSFKDNVIKTAEWVQKELID